MSAGTGTPDTQALIGRLAADLPPVRRLWRPSRRAAAWLGLVALGAILLSLGTDLRLVAARIEARPDMWLAVLGSVATTVAAAVAALMLALPDRDGRWALLPLPPLLLWLGACGAGCLRQDLIGLVHPATFSEATGRCLPFIVKTSLLLAVPLGYLLWRARPLRLGAVAWVGGLAVAAGAASLLWLDHPYDATLVDLIAHAVAVGLVMICCRVVSLLLPE